MSKSIDNKINHLLDDAERNQHCLVAMDAATNAQLMRRVRNGNLINPSPHLYARLNSWQKLSSSAQTLWRLRGLGLLHPEWTFCCFSAAIAYGLSVSNSLLTHTHILTQTEHKKRSKGRTVRHAIKDESFALVNQIRCTSLERTVFDCARLAPFECALAIVDSALRKELISKEDLFDYISNQTGGWHGAPQARTVCQLSSPLAESGGESIARGLMIRLGFEIPELQVTIPDLTNPSRTYRVDFLWRLTGRTLIIGEFDGREKYTNSVMTNGRDINQVLIDERLRESRISGTGAKIMRFGYKDLLDEQFFYHLLETFGVPRASRPILIATNLNS